MRITLTTSFERDFKKRAPEEKEQVYKVLSKLPAVIGKVHLHGGVGIRKMHPSGIFEARIGLDLRILFGFSKHEIVLHRIGNHEAIRKYLKNL